ncbi:MAG: hypothetical protein Sylvanvirus33_7, partial [Sylvanvirus sp.]
DGMTLRYISNPCHALQQMAIEQNGNAIRYVQTPSEDMKLKAVNQTPFAIKSIPRPWSKELKEIAIRDAPRLEKYIKRMESLDSKKYIPK